MSCTFLPKVSKSEISEIFYEILVVSRGGGGGGSVQFMLNKFGMATRFCNKQS